MKLYHGTNERHLAHILKHGLQPRGEGGKGNWDATAPSNPNAIYLTVAYAPYFAYTSTDTDTHERLVILEIDTDRLDESLLCPDEDCLEQGTRLGDIEEAAKLAVNANYQAKGHPEWGNLSMLERTKMYQSVMATEYRDKWEISLKALGTCAYLGTIPPSAISRYALYDVDHGVPTINVRLVDPSISLANFRFCADDYRKLTAWFFGRNLTWQDIRRVPENIDKEMSLKQGMSETDYDKFRDEALAEINNHRGLEIWQRKNRKWVRV